MDKREILKESARAWINGQKNELGRSPIEFYSGRIMMFHLIESLGGDGEHLYEITPENILDYSASEIVEMFMD